MKILHLTPHLEIGGIPRHVLDLCSQLQSQGHDVTVASTGGVQIGALKAAGVKHLQIPLSSKFEFGPNLWRSWLALLPALQSGSFDIVHAHTRIAQVLGGLIENKHGIPCVTTCHGFFKTNLGRRLWPCWEQKVIAVSPAVQEHLVRVHRVAMEKIVCIPNGIDTEKYQQGYDEHRTTALRQQLGIPKGCRVVGTTARLSPVKGLNHLLDAFALCLKADKNLCCLIVGEGPVRKELEVQAKNLGIAPRVVFAGAVDNVAPYLALMEVFVLPSRMEGLGLSILEAFAAGKPVVASRVGGIVDVIRNNENGLLVSPGSPQEIARAMQQILADEKLGARLAQEGNKTVRRDYSLDRMVQAVQSLYDAVKISYSNRR